MGVTCLGSSFVILNSFLPLLVANHPQFEGSYEGRTANESGTLPGPGGGTTSDTDQRMGPTYRLDDSQTDSAALKLSTKISSKGVGIGYAAAVFVQVLSIMLLFGMSKLSVSSTLPLRLVLFVVGSWWLGFTIPASIWLRDRPGPPLPTPSNAGMWRNGVAYITFAWASVWKTLKVAVKLRQMVIFLVAW